MLVPDGTYIGVATQQAVAESKNGALMVYFNFKLIDGPKPGVAIKAQQCIVKKDGSVNEKCIAGLKEVFGWSGSDPFWFVDNDLTGIQASLVISNKQQEDGKIYSEVNWINPIGGGNLPDSGDKRSLMAKYGAKLRAVAGGAPVTPPIGAAKPLPAPASTPLAAPLPGKDLAAPLPTSTQDECWVAFQAEYPNRPATDLNRPWFDMLESIIPNKLATELEPADWGKVKAYILKSSDEVPF